MTAPRSVLVVGAGLIGTSIGLALRDTVEVWLTDEDRAHLAAAVRRGAGRSWDTAAANRSGVARPEVDLAVVCVPPSRTAQITSGLLGAGVASTVSHVASSQSQVEREVEALLAASPGAERRFCGGHPLAGRESRGPAAASARLFLDRPWVLCPTPATSDEAVRDVHWLATACGALPLRMSADEHDAAVARVSHVPQVAASALAAALLHGAGDAQLALAGTGLQDTTRIAASDPELWVDILRSNAAHVAPLLRDLVADVDGVASDLERLAADPADDAAATRLRELLDRGRRGRAAVPLKRESPGTGLTSLVISVPDEPGQLAGILNSAADAGVNVEDVRVEHLPGRPRGLLELVVSVEAVAGAREALSRAGWDVLDD
jgi:prephenate dehydrogenase